VQIDGRAALVSGANRGLGRHLAEQLRDRGAQVYAGARDPDAVDLDGVTPVALDITDPDSVARAAIDVGELAILVNNAGATSRSSFLAGSPADIRADMEVNYFGTLAVTRAFAPRLGEQPESAVLNILSALSWLSLPSAAAYCASKAAEWSLTNALRQELAGQGTTVTGLHVAFMETEMAANVEAPKSDPAEVARQGIEAIAAGEFEVIADDVTRQVLGGLSGGVGALYPDLAPARA
jgi:NAD(P)-dependent dehydrogenase (short-subunit alcohol dehydrogenase family)